MILKLWGSITMHDEHLGFWSFLVYTFYEYCIRQEIIFSHLIKLLLKSFYLGKQVPKLFLWELEAKHHFKHV